MYSSNYNEPKQKKNDFKHNFNLISNLHWQRF